MGLLASLARSIRGVVADRPLATPPRTVEDAEGRTVDLRPVADGDREALVAMYDDFDPAQRAQGTPPLGEAAIREWLDSVAEGPGVVAVHGDRAVGHVTFVGDERGHELAIFVHQAYQRAGIGTELLATGLGHARERGVERVWLTVEPWKRHAVALYGDFGFTLDRPATGTYRMSRLL